MTTREERSEQISEMLLDPDLHVKPLEGLAMIREWFMFELALIAHDRAERRCEKWVGRMNDRVDLYNFRKEMADI